MELEVNPRETAVLAIDMHRGHLDPEIATMPVDPEWGSEVTKSAAHLFKMARSAQIPIVHTILESRQIPGLGREAMVNPFRQAQMKSKESLASHFNGLERHNVEGDATTEAMPQLVADYEIRTKRRLGSFYGTDLDILLRALKVNTLLIAGINTNTCVHNACFEAFNRDFKVVVLEDCVASMYGRDLHDFALENVRRCLGWVTNTQEISVHLGT